MASTNQGVFSHLKSEKPNLTKNLATNIKFNNIQRNLVLTEPPTAAQSTTAWHKFTNNCYINNDENYLTSISTSISISNNRCMTATTSTSTILKAVSIDVTSFSSISYRRNSEIAHTIGDENRSRWIGLSADTSSYLHPYVGYAPQVQDRTILKPFITPGHHGHVKALWFYIFRNSGFGART